MPDSRRQLQHQSNCLRLFKFFRKNHPKGLRCGRESCKENTTRFIRNKCLTIQCYNIIIKANQRL